MPRETQEQKHSWKQWNKQNKKEHNQSALIPLLRHQPAIDHFCTYLFGLVTTILLLHARKVYLPLTSLF
jgi:hypothetical protein